MLSIVKMESFKKHIAQIMAKESRFSKRALLNEIRYAFPEMPINTINKYLTLLKVDGVINSPSRGIYEFGPGNTYVPSFSNELRELNSVIKKEFPFADFCICDTQWLNEFMVHQPFKRYFVIDAEKDVAFSIFECLKALKINAFLDPKEPVYEYYIGNSENPIIVKPLITEAPVNTIDGVCVASLEKVFVDMIVDQDLYAAQQGEIEYIFKNALNKYQLNFSKIHRYSKRRNKGKEIDTLVLST